MKMTDIWRMRARRFHALYTMLTGAAEVTLPNAQHLSEHLMKDVGLTKTHRPLHISGLFAAYPTAPSKRRLRVTPKNRRTQK